MSRRLYLGRLSWLVPHQSTTVASFLLPCVHPSNQIRRAASVLASLSDNRAAYNKRIRRGRGPASGKGKTSGRGHKGQKQHGKVPAGFEGGQTPQWKVKGERGFKNIFSDELALVNLDKIQSWVAQGRIDARKPITIKELKSSGCVGTIKDGVKLLARAEEQLNYPIHITVSRASAAAITAIEAAGGSVQTRYYTRDSIKRIMAGKTHPTLSLLSPPPSSPTPSTSTVDVSKPADSPLKAAFTSSPGSGLPTHLLPTKSYRYRLPDPTSRKDIEYYRDPAHRGYLSYQLGEGEGPSLFYRTPMQISTSRRKKGKGASGILKGEGVGAVPAKTKETKLF